MGRRGDALDVSYEIVCSPDVEVKDRHVPMAYGHSIDEAVSQAVFVVDRQNIPKRGAAMFGLADVRSMEWHSAQCSTAIRRPAATAPTAG